MTEVRHFGLEGVVEIIPRKFGDDRGFFSETYNARQFAAHGIDLAFVQDNHSLSASAGVVRGLHYQLPPMAQDKLVRVVARRASSMSRSTSGRARRHSASGSALEVSAAKWNQILVPAGFAHGFLTLEPDTEVVYKVTRILFAGA